MRPHVPPEGCGSCCEVEGKAAIEKGKREFEHAWPWSSKEGGVGAVAHGVTEPTAARLKVGHRRIDISQDCRSLALECRGRYRSPVVVLGNGDPVGVEAAKLRDGL